MSAELESELLRLEKLTKQQELSLNGLCDAYNNQVDIIRDLNTKLLQSLVILDDLLNSDIPNVATAREFLSAFKTDVKVGE
jgi:hypothetical protein